MNINIILNMKSVWAIKNNRDKNHLWVWDDKKGSRVIKLSLNSIEGIYQSSKKSGNVDVGILTCWREGLLPVVLPRNRANAFFRPSVLPSLDPLSNEKQTVPQNKILEILTATEVLWTGCRISFCYCYLYFSYFCNRFR